jgi:putative protease
MILPSRLIKKKRKEKIYIENILACEYYDLLTKYEQDCTRYGNNRPWFEKQKEKHRLWEEEWEKGAPERARQAELAAKEAKQRAEEEARVAIERARIHAEKEALRLNSTFLGTIKHFYQKIGVAIIELSDEIDLEDKIMVEGSTTYFTQSVTSIEIDGKKVTSAKNGQRIGLEVKDRVREGDLVFKL